MAKLRPAKIYCKWQLPIKFKHQRLIEIFVDGWEDLKANKDSIKILYLCEPNEISKLNRKAVRNKKKFDYIFTHDEDVLRRCPNALLFPFGSSWIRNYKFKRKPFAVSTVVGAKKRTKGHKLRLKLWKNQNQITIPKFFYLSHHAKGRLKNINNNPLLGKVKNPMFDCQFHIAIENVRKNNWFTEKLIDCFRTKTVPVYWGCPNIGDFFNSDGILQINSLKNLIDVVNSLTPKTYQDMKTAVKENYRLSEKYIVLVKRFEEKLKDIFN